MTLEGRDIRIQLVYFLVRLLHGASHGAVAARDGLGRLPGPGKWGLAERGCAQEGGEPVISDSTDLVEVAAP